MISTPWRRVFGILIVVLAIGMGAEYAWQTASERRIVECQARINLAFSRVLKARGDLSDADRAANRKLLEAIAQATTPGQVRKAEHTYLATQRRLDRERDAYPYPKIRPCR